MPPGDGYTGHMSTASRAALTFAVAPVAAAAVIGGLGSRHAPEVYGRLRKPRWAPPAGAFGPVWSTLYVTICVAGHRIARHGSSPTRTLHLTQLAANAAWPVVFFGRRDKRVSLAVITALDLALTAEIFRLRDEDPRAAALLLPYLAWTGFATALNASVSDSTRRTVGLATGPTRTVRGPRTATRPRLRRRPDRPAHRPS